MWLLSMSPHWVYHSVWYWNSAKATPIVPSSHPQTISAIRHKLHLDIRGPYKQPACSCYTTVKWQAVKPMISFSRFRCSNHYKSTIIIQSYSFVHTNLSLKFQLHCPLWQQFFFHLLLHLSIQQKETARHLMWRHNDIKDLYLSPLLFVFVTETT